MKKTPGWMIWSALAAGWWVAWIFVVYLPLHGQDSDLQREGNKLNQEKKQAQQLITSAPLVVDQIEAIKSEFQRTTAEFVLLDDFSKLQRDLKNQASKQGLTAVALSPDLAGVLELKSDSSSVIDEGGGPAGLQVELKAQGRFAAVGGWLDQIEQRADFQRWVSCRWAGGTGEGKIDFQAAAIFWVIAQEATPEATFEGR